MQKHIIIYFLFSFLGLSQKDFFVTKTGCEYEFEVLKCAILP